MHCFIISYLAIQASRGKTFFATYHMISMILKIWYFLFEDNLSRTHKVRIIQTTGRQSNSAELEKMKVLKKSYSSASCPANSWMSPLSINTLCKKWLSGFARCIWSKFLRFNSCHFLEKQSLASTPTLLTVRHGLVVWCARSSGLPPPPYKQLVPPS